jgi:ABC-type phosphate transport system permease subunit
VKQFFAVLESLIAIILVLVGVTGISYRSFREGGWITQGFSKAVNTYVEYPAIALGTTVALFFIYRAWRDRRDEGRRSKVFDYIVYVFMAAGIYFIGHYVLTGRL